MSKKPQRKTGPVAKLKTPLPAGAVHDPGMERVIRQYREVVQRYKVGVQRRNEALLRGERDDLPRVKIPTPVVKPKGVKPQQIRKAVRKAVEDYIERHSKSLGRS